MEKNLFSFGYVINTYRIHEIYWYLLLIHWGRVTYICVSKLTIVGSDNGLATERRQTII